MKVNPKKFRANDRNERVVEKTKYAWSVAPGKFSSALEKETGIKLKNDANFSSFVEHLKEGYDLAGFYKNSEGENVQFNTEEIVDNIKISKREHIEAIKNGRLTEKTPAL